MKRTLSMLSSKGDTLLAEVDTETKEATILRDEVSGMTKAEIAEVEALFQQKISQGYSAFVTTDQKNEQIRQYDPNEDILLVPAMQGGMR